MESPQPTVRAKRLTKVQCYNFLKNHWFDYLILFLFGGVIIGS